MNGMKIWMNKWMNEWMNEWILVIEMNEMSFQLISESFQVIFASFRDFQLERDRPTDQPTDQPTNRQS